MAVLTTSRPSAIAPGESVSPAARMATNAEPHAVTVTSPAASAATSVRIAAVAGTDTSRTLIAMETAEEGCL